MTAIDDKQKKELGMDSDRVEKGLTIAGLVFAVALYLCIAYFSCGYDDEYWNIQHIEEASSLSAMVQSTIDTDTHPPLSYIINYLLFQLFENWSVVRMIGAGLCAVSVWMVWYHLYARADRLWKIYSYVLVCLNPTLLLWCTSLRWYTYMVIFICALEILLAYRNRIKKVVFWGLLFLIYVIMFYLEYSAAILIVISLGLIVLNSKEFKKEALFLVLFGAISLICVIPQIYTFVTVKYPFGKAIGEIYSPIRCILGAGQNILCGQGAFPIAPAGILLGIGNLMLCFGLFGNLKKILGKKRHIFFLSAYVLITILGIGGKIRNYTPIAVRQSDLFVELAKETKQKLFQRIGMVLILIGSIWSVLNVLTHTDTTKGGWNTPYVEIVSYVSEKYDVNRTAIWTHDPVLWYYLRDEGYPLIGDTSGWTEEMENAIAGGKTIVIASTYKGSLSDENYILIRNYIERPDSVLDHVFGEDKYAWLKQKMDPVYPEYYCEIYCLPVDYAEMQK